MNDETNKRLAEIKARAEAAEAVPEWGDTRRVAALVACGEDVPFLLEQLEQASTELAVFRAKTHDEQLSAALKLVGVGNDRISRAAEMGLADAANAARIEVGFELRDLAKKLAASEAAAAQMRAALEYAKDSMESFRGRDGYKVDVAGIVLHRANAALATDAVKGWVPPEEAKQKDAEIGELRKQRLSEIKARAEAAEAPYVDDVPFLLEQLKTWRMTSAVFEKAAESAQAKLAASEAAAGQMADALGWAYSYLHGNATIRTAEEKIESARQLTAGKGWLSPEEAERTKNEMATLRECKSIVEHQRNEHREEVERLRKELERRETHHKELHNANEQLSASLTSADNRYYLLLDATEKGGLVSEEECARRCREVVRRWDDFCNPDMRISYVPETEAELLAIIDRVAKGGAR